MWVLLTSTFFNRNWQFWLFREIKVKIEFQYINCDSFDFYWVLKGCFDQCDCYFYDVSKIGHSRVKSKSEEIFRTNSCVWSWSFWFEVSGKETVGGSPFTSIPNRNKAGHHRGFDFWKCFLFFLDIYYVDHLWVSTYNNSSKRRTLKDADVISDHTEDNAEKIIRNLKYIFQGGHSR